jgi:predicted ATP-binding protein involved in virulence
MYIRNATIRNIRSIEAFSMEFPKRAAGWHVLIGDNGAGKSTIIRSLALALVGPKEALGLRADWRDWLRIGQQEGEIKIELSNDKLDSHTGQQRSLTKSLIPNILRFTQQQNGTIEFSDEEDSKEKDTKGQKRIDPFTYNWGKGKGWFSVAFGPFRRFAGGNQEWAKIFYSQPKLGAHLSVFGEDIALTEAIEWLKQLNYQALEQDTEAAETLEHLKTFINSSGFLPHQAMIERISSEGVFFKDGNGSLIHVNQLSDGYRSILSLTFELIRQLVRVYSATTVFRQMSSGKLLIDVPGVVLIDEIDSHLHPTWQTRIGKWFVKYFPNIQFIVTTHSPLVCRACEHGTIWRLSAPGSSLPSGQIMGMEKEKLVYGNILDAYGTNVFGTAITISQEAVHKRNRWSELKIKALFSPSPSLNENEQQELITLEKIFSTEKLMLP